MGSLFQKHARANSVGDKTDDQRESKVQMLQDAFREQMVSLDQHLPLNKKNVKVGLACHRRTSRCVCARSWYGLCGAK